MTRENHRIHFPHTISRFTALEGGQYGTADLIALSRRQLEVRLGGDFVDFSHKQAIELRNAVDRFLDLCEDRECRAHHHPHSPSDGRIEVVEKIEEIIEERVEERVDAQARERGPRRKKD